MGSGPLFEKYGHTIQSGKIIFREGDDGNQMFIIQNGKVRISKNIDGKEHILAVLGKGDFFGEMAIVTSIKRTATATAIGAVDLLCFDRSGFQGMIENNSKIALNIIDKLCRRLQQANHQIQHLVKGNAKNLVALNLYYAFQERKSGNPPIPFDRTLEEISLNLELPEKRLRAIFSELQEEGIISINQNSLNLVDQESLNRIAENTGNKIR
ncbi:MAG: Crp/Fnr family transcriptional regulator [Spirochaetia bacterium]